jgi:polysaccharide deacetylase family protein (PEP-CTERM system associated)
MSVPDRVASITGLLTFDVEDWFHSENVRAKCPPESWDGLDQRVEIGMRVIMDMLARDQIRGTFFILGWIAERYPQLVKEIAAAGHEVASHGYGHIMPVKQSLIEVRDDLVRAKEILENMTGKAVHGYRAPCFGIDDARLQLVFQTGHSYDSSFNPFGAHDRYGKLADFEGSPRPGLLKVRGGGLELPMPIVKVAGLTLPISGGGWFRLYPGAMFRQLAHSWAQEHGFFILYLHPWEFDPAQPRMPIRRSFAFRNYVNLHRTGDRLERLIQSFRDSSTDFKPVQEFLESIPAS